MTDAKFLAQLEAITSELHAPSLRDLTSESARLKAKLADLLENSLTINALVSGDRERLQIVSLLPDGVAPLETWALPARYNGKCWACNKAIKGEVRKGVSVKGELIEGELITRWGPAWAHVSCIQRVLSDPIVLPVQEINVLIGLTDCAETLRARLVETKGRAALRQLQDEIATFGDLELVLFCEGEIETGDLYFNGTDDESLERLLKMRDDFRKEQKALIGRERQKAKELQVVVKVAPFNTWIERATDAQKRNIAASINKSIDSAFDEQLAKQERAALLEALKADIERRDAQLTPGDEKAATIKSARNRGKRTAPDKYTAAAPVRTGALRDSIKAVAASLLDAGIDLGNGIDAAEALAKLSMLPSIGLPSLNEILQDNTLTPREKQDAAEAAQRRMQSERPLPVRALESFVDNWKEETLKVYGECDASRMLGALDYDNTVEYLRDADSGTWEVILKDRNIDAISMRIAGILQFEPDTESGSRGDESYDFSITFDTSGEPLEYSLNNRRPALSLSA